MPHLLRRSVIQLVEIVKKKAYKLVFDDVRLQIIQLIRNVWKTLNNLDYGDVCCSLLMYFIFLFSFFRWLHSTVKLPLQMISKQTAYKSRCEGVLNFHASILCTYNAILKYLWECLFNFLKYFSICLPVSITELPTPDISRLLTPFLLNIRRQHLYSAFPRGGPLNLSEKVNFIFC